MSMSMEQGVGMHPALLAVTRAEIFEQTTTDGKSFGEKYPVMSELCTKSRVSYILITGPSGTGKTAWGMGLVRTQEVDPALVNHDIIPVPFALFADVAKYKRKIRPNVSHGGYTPEEYRLITKEMYVAMQDYAYAHPSKKIVYDIEMSSPSVYPDVTDIRQLLWRGDETRLVPVRSGNADMVRDRGHSAGYTLALGKYTRDATQLVILERSKGVKDMATQVRSAESPDVITNLNQRGFTVLLEDAEKVPVNLNTLDNETYTDLNTLLRKTYAPANTIPISDAELKAARKSISHTPLATERSWNLWLGEQLLMDKDRFSIVQNEFLHGDKTFDIRYFLDSLVYRLYPSLLPESLKRFVKKGI